MNKPQNVRNAWVEVEVEGRERMVATGPRGRHDGMIVRFWVRDRGASVRSVTVETAVTGDGALILRVADQDGVVVYTHTTQR